MSKLNQIQQKIRELNGGSFQKLADSYLIASGYQNIVSLGSVVGSDGTRKGTPDSYFVLPNGKYVFAEYTVQKDRLFEKINEDIDKCFDISITNIEPEKIQEIVYCHTSQLYPFEIDKLTKKCRDKNVLLRIIGIDMLSQGLYQKYPKIARDFLGVEVDTGQILSVEDFVASYDKNAMATPLSINFHFRETELLDIINALENNDSVIIAGKAGVGKSRLALECCRKYAKEQQTTKVWCIKNNGQNIFEDLKIYFSDPGNYLIFIDDANQTTPLGDILAYLHKKDQGINVKIIATVRNYALQRVVDKFFEQTRPHVIRVGLLKDEQIREIAKNEFKITNSLYLDRIERIAQGNARLAVMACKIAVEKNTLESILDTTRLLEEYFRNVRKDLQDLKDIDILKVAGAITFVNQINLKDSENVEKICEITGVEKTRFLSLIVKLHNMEILDIYENEAVKISDQILATYLFYLVFIDKKILPYSELFKAYFPRIKQRIIEALNSVFIHFDYSKVNQVIKTELNIVWDAFENDKDTRLTDLMLTFWFVRESETLIYIKRKIDELRSDYTEPETYLISKNEGSHTPEIITTLIQYSSSSIFISALCLIFEYLVKKPEDFTLIYFKLAKDLGFDEDSYYRNYQIQTSVIQVLIERSNHWENKLFTMLFLRVAKHYLGFVFEQTKFKGRSLVFYKVPLIFSPSLSYLRGMIWFGLIELFDIPIYQDEVVEILLEYGKDFYKEPDKKVATIDIDYIRVFIKEKLLNSNFKHCLAVNHLVQVMKRFGLQFDDIDVTRFQEGAYKVYSLLKGIRHIEEFDWKREQELKKLDIENYIKGFGFEEYKNLFKLCREIKDITSIEEWEVSEGMAIVFSFVGKFKELFPQVVSLYLSENAPFNVYPMMIIQRLIEIIGVSETEKLIQQYNYSNKSIWQYCFFASIPKEMINKEYLVKLYEYFRDDEGEIIGWARDISFLQNYIDVDSEVFVKVTEIILSKEEKEPNIIVNTLRSLFNSRSELHIKVFDLFSQDMQVLKRAYLTLMKLDRNIDYDSSFLKEMVKRDIHFLEEYIAFMITNHDEMRFHRDDKDFTFIWDFENYSEIVSLAINTLIKETEHNNYLLRNYIKQVFLIRKNDTEIKNKQDEWIKNYIKDNCNNYEKIKLIFYSISCFEIKRRIELISFLLTVNDSFEIFKQIYLEPDSWSWSGSEVPVLEERIKYYEMLLPVLSSVNLLKHRKYIEDYIRWLRDQVKKVKIEEFMRDY